MEIEDSPAPVTMLREHIAKYGTAKDGRIFRTRTGGTYSSSVHSYVWQEARKRARTPVQVVSSLTARPYDLHHAAVSLWLDASVPAPEVAKRAGHSDDVLLRVYAKCMNGRQEEVCLGDCREV
jgi:integrase